jgi:DNA repair exonuclease SbcCD ATPase subunit
MTEEQVVEQQPQIETSENRSKEEYNFAQMRKKIEEAERRAQEAERVAQSYQQSSPQLPQVPQEQDEDLNIDNEDYVQAKHVKTSTKRLNKRVSDADKKIEELYQKLSYFEAKVDTDSLKDFDSIVSNENLKTLATLYPDDYQTMMASPNLKAKSKTAYNMIKNYGIVSKPDTSKLDEKILANKAKPQSSSITSPQSPSTPLTRLEDYERRVLSEDDRSRILKDLERKKMAW